MYTIIAFSSPQAGYWNYNLQLIKKKGEYALQIVYILLGTFWSSKKGFLFQLLPRAFGLSLVDARCIDRSILPYLYLFSFRFPSMFSPSRHHLDLFLNALLMRQRCLDVLTG